MRGDSPDNQADIRDLCRKWRAAATGQGGITIGGASERFRLHRNGVVFHELPYSELRQAAVGLTEVLLLPGKNTVIDMDHYLFWSWSAEILLGPGGTLSSDPNFEIAELATCALRASLAGASGPSLKAWETHRRADALLDQNSREFLVRSHYVVAYLAFPLLEALCRRACRTYVDFDGTVLRSFARLSGKNYTVGARCSNVADTLALLVTQVASRELRTDLQEVLSHVGTFAAKRAGSQGRDGFSTLFDWRNASLHGEVAASTIGGTVLSLALMVALDDARMDYERLRIDAAERAELTVVDFRRTGRWNPAPWSFYPAFPE